MTFALVPILIFLISPVLGQMFHSSTLFPAYVEEGGSAVMRCGYNKEKKTGIKWYKDNKEFYNFEYDIDNDIYNGLRKQHPDLPRGSVEIHDYGQMIILTNVTEKMAGNFKCEITKEIENGPSPWLTDEIKSSLVVVILPKGPPTIEVINNEENTTLVCRSELSRPPAKFQWYKNNRRISPPVHNYFYTINKHLAEDSFHIAKGSASGEDTFKCTITVDLPGRLVLSTILKKDSKEKLIYSVTDKINCVKNKTNCEEDYKGELIFFNQASVLLDGSGMENRSSESLSNNMMIILCILFHLLRIE